MHTLGKPALTGEITPTDEQLIRLVAADLDAGADMNNSHRGARILRALFDLYGEDDSETAIRDALADIRHACDLTGLEMRECDERAREAYAAETLEEGAAPHISEGWT